MMKKIGILCASDTELDPFLLHLQKETRKKAGMLTFHEGIFGEMPLVCFYSGVGKVNAAIGTQLLIDRFSPDAVICAGCAGAVDDTLARFDTVVSEEITYHDMKEDILTDFHPWMSSPFFRADATLLAAAKRAAEKTELPVRFGRSVTGDAFIESLEARNAIRRRFSPLSVDMESAAAAHVCYVNGVPFLSVRTITDAANAESAALFETNVEKDSLLAANFVWGLLAVLSQ